MQRRLRFTDASGATVEAAQFSDGVIIARWPDGRAYMWLNAQAMEEDENVTSIEWIDDDDAQWLLELVHVVYGMAKREHLGPLPQLVPAHAEEALRRVPASVKAAASIPEGEA